MTGYCPFWVVIKMVSVRSGLKMRYTKVSEFRVLVGNEWLRVGESKKYDRSTPWGDP